MMISNRYSCFLLYGEGEVDDVSVAEECVTAKKKKGALGNTSTTNAKTSTPVKATVKGKNQPQTETTKKSGSGPAATTHNKNNSVIAAPSIVKDTTDFSSKITDKFGKGKSKAEHIQNDHQRFQRNRWNDPPKTEEVAEEKEPEFFIDNKEEKEVIIEDGAEIIDEEEEMVEEAKLMTLAEWKALQQPREKPVYNLRQPGEGEDMSQWTKMVLKKDKEEEEIHLSEDFEYAENEYPQRAARHKKLEIDCLFVGLPRERGRGDGERDLRNKGRRNVNRRRFEENQINRSAPKVDDINDFPSLG